MNDQNINESFNNVFDDSGWIITKNEKGKVKIANCKQDETNLYDKTRDWKIKEVDNMKKTDTFQFSQAELYKTGRFFIRDLLDAKKQNKYFVCNDMCFISVYICGTVVSFYERDEKHSIVVDDGTSSIKCIMKKEDNEYDGESSKLSDADLNNLCKQYEDDIFLQCAMMLRRATRNLQSMVPKFHELELGDVVRIFGTVSEYNGNRYIFIKKIVKEPKETIAHVAYLEDMLHIYSDIYKKLNFH